MGLTQKHFSGAMVFLPIPRYSQLSGGFNLYTEASTLWSWPNISGLIH